MTLLKLKDKPPSAGKPQAASGEPALPRWILWGRLLVPLVALLMVGGVLAFTRLHHSAPREIQDGAIVNGRQQAPDFALTDQNGQPRQLSDFRGRPVALTFIYTNCIDVCPLIAWNMHLAYDQLGADAKNVQLLAVTVDPEHDTPAQMRAFSDQRQITNQWYFLTGVRPALEQVWRSYGIQAQPVDSAGTPLPESLDLANMSPEQIEHAAPTFLIDKQGNVRVMMPVDFTADALENNLRVLLSEN